MCINNLRVACRVFVDFVQYLCLCARPASDLAADNLFFRKQLALFKERNVKAGIEPTGKRVYMRDCDWWRLSENKILENWCMVDTLHLALQLGRDVIEEIRE